MTMIDDRSRLASILNGRRQGAPAQKLGGLFGLGEQPQAAGRERAGRPVVDTAHLPKRWGY